MDRATTPDRPDGVPAEAVPCEEDGGWTFGATDAEGRTGVWRCWRTDGTLAETSHWHRGRMHGEHFRYHDDGSVALTGQWHEGKRCTLLLHRPDGPSQETVMDQLPESVRSMVQDFDEDGYFIRQRFWTADGSEVDLDGEPIPPRPANVPEDAQHATRHGHWYLQRFAPDGEEPSVGLHRFWETGGALKGVEYHTIDDGLRARLDYRSPLIEAERYGDGRAVEQCLALGLGTSPGAALHAAHEGLTALARRLLSGETGPERAEFTDPRTEPERREAIPDEAVWVAGLKSWVVGEVDGDTGAALGTWRLWLSRPHLDADQVIVAEFRDGRPVSRREYVPWRPEDLDEEWTYDAEGEVLLHRKYERGRRKAETEYLPDGTVAHRRFHRTDRVERVERDEALVSEVWFAEDGTRRAEVAPSGLLVEGEPVEWWRGLDASGAVIAEGPVEQGLKGGPVGRWKLYGVDGADGTERAMVVFDQMDVRRDADLGQFAHGLHLWRTLPVPDVLAGVDDIDWSRYESFFGGSEDFPFLLKGLAVPDEFASGHALGVLWDGVLHQHTVSGIAGPAMRFVIALAESGRGDQSLLELILRVVTRDGSLDATRQLKELHTAAAGAKDPAGYFGENGVESSYHEIYSCLAAATPAWARLAAGTPGTSREDQDARDAREDREAREMAVHLLAAAPGEAAAAALRDLLAAEAARGGARDRESLGDLLLCLGLVPGDATRDLVEPFLTDEDPLLAFCAALTWVRIGATPGPQVLRLLTGALTDLPALDGFGAHWFAEGDASGDALDVLSQLPPEHSRDCLEQMCALLDSAGTFVAPRLARSLLDIVFPTEAYGEGEPLTADQRRVVGALAGTVARWNFVNVDMNEVLRLNGLPCTADELRALCAKE
ncbi:toxin-antitoxin system YwqK family antitoxin [Streptomyces qinzhouensis]|uniref:Uncharacterized protein n=1 Tax=Streptomyces qinzhouensis TaxID=2599401 RepID=A0A5B8JJF2_9ACTN|nr:hypothetical protein [Streptomyces qinzhouensis]QDY77950.1 hypothetical protein FQU76_17190 [Streptomyces qinzhouensis]